VLVGLAVESKLKSESWRMLRVLLLTAVALFVFCLAIAYKYTGDFSGLATFGTSRRTPSQN
jgi:hypothetical protein